MGFKPVKGLDDALGLASDPLVDRGLVERTVLDQEGDDPIGQPPEILMPPSADASGPRDRALSPEQAARMIGRSRDWCYRHRHELPTTRLSSGRWIVSEARLRRWMESRSR